MRSFALTAALFASTSFAWLPSCSVSFAYAVVFLCLKLTLCLVVGLHGKLGWIFLLLQQRMGLSLLQPNCHLPIEHLCGYLVHQQHRPGR
jgi:hypothetical protein